MDSSYRSALEAELQKEQARRDFLTYCRQIDKKYQTPPHIVYLAGLLQQVDQGIIPKLAICIAPRHGKSRLISRFCAWYLHRGDRRNILIVSGSERVAIQNSRWVREDVLSPDYPWDVTLDDSSTSILSWSTSLGCRVRAVTSNAIITGLQSNISVLDDVQPDAGTPNTRDSLQEWLQSTLETRCEPGAPVILINSRHSTDDIYARIQASEDVGQWTFVNLEALNETQDDPLGREVGEALWPQKWSVPLLEKKKAAVGSRVWESQYMGHPTVEGGRLIPVDCFREYEHLPSLPEIQETQEQMLSRLGEYHSPFLDARATEASFYRVTAIDASGVALTTSGGGYSAWVTVMIDLARNDFYIIHMGRVKGVDFNHLRLQVQGDIVAQNPDVVVVEHAGQGGRLGESIQSFLRRPVIFHPPGHESKEDRVTKILPWLEAGHMFLPKRAAWDVKAFRSELQDFPAGTSSDITDAWAYAVAYGLQGISRKQMMTAVDQTVRQLSGGWMFSR